MNNPAIVDFAIDFFSNHYTGRGKFKKYLPGGEFENLDSLTAADGILKNDYGKKYTASDVQDVADVIDMARQQVKNKQDPTAVLDNLKRGVDEEFEVKDLQAQKLRDAIKLVDPKQLAIEAIGAAASEGAKATGDIIGDRENKLAAAMLSATREGHGTAPVNTHGEAAGEAMAQGRMHKGFTAQRVGHAIGNVLDRLMGKFDRRVNELNARIGQTYAPLTGGGYDYLRSLGRYAGPNGRGY